MFLEELGDCRIIMNLLINLYNFQCTSTIGHNQILSTFMKPPATTTNKVPSYKKVDLVAEYFLEVGRGILPNGNGVFSG